MLKSEQKNHIIEVSNFFILLLAKILPIAKYRYIFGLLTLFISPFCATFSFAQNVDEKLFDKPLTAINNQMTMRSIAKCDIAMDRLIWNKSVDFTKDELEKYRRFIRVIVMETNKNGLLSENFFYEAKRTYDYEDEAIFNDLNKVYLDCRNQLSPHLAKNKLFNEIFISGQKDVFGSFVKLSIQTDIGMSYKQVVNCRYLTETAYKPRGLMSNHGIRLNGLLELISNLQNEIRKEFNISWVEMDLFVWDFNNKWKEPSKKELEVDFYKCMGKLRPIVVKRFESLLQATYAENRDVSIANNSVKFAEKETCVFTFALNSIINQSEPNKLIVYTESDIYFSRINKAQIIDSKDIEGIGPHLAKAGVPYAVIISNPNEGIVYKTSTTRSKNYNYGPESKWLRKEDFLAKSDKNVGLLKNYIDVIALSCDMPF